MPEPTAACFPPSSVFFFLLLNVPFGETTGVNSHQLHKRSYTTIIIFPPGREASKSTGCNLVLNTKHGQLAGSQLNKFEKSALMCVPTIFSDVVGQTCSYTIWLTVIRRCQFKSLAYDQCKRTHAFSGFQSSVTQAFPLLFCLLYFSAYAFCFLHQTCTLDLHTFTYIYHVASVLKLESESKGLMFYSVALRSGIVCKGVFVLNKYWSLTICTFLNLVEVEAKHSKRWPCFKKKIASPAIPQLQCSSKKQISEFHHFAPLPNACKDLFVPCNALFTRKDSRPKVWDGLTSWWILVRVGAATNMQT